jgi:hypothetical protein
MIGSSTISAGHGQDATLIKSTRLNSANFVSCMSPETKRIALANAGRNSLCDAEAERRVERVLEIVGPNLPEKVIRINQ